MSYKTFCNTVNVITPLPSKYRSAHFFSRSLTENYCDRELPQAMKGINHSNRLKRMINKYTVEEPALILEFLEGMKKQQKNKCCYCGVGMCDLFGQSHSITLERVDDSKTHILSNIKFACFSCNSAHRK